MGRLPMSDVFLSYKSEDAARVAPVVCALQSAGLNVWWDRHLPGGENWQAANPSRPLASPSA